jgi:uncharacterized protein (DUF2384 family)
MPKAIDQDINDTFYKLRTLLEFSSSPRAEEVLEVLQRAAALWESEEQAEAWEE